jgi:hypothetical protein
MIHSNLLPGFTAFFLNQAGSLKINSSSVYTPINLYLFSPVHFNFYPKAHPSKYITVDLVGAQLLQQFWLLPSKLVSWVRESNTSIESVQRPAEEAGSASYQAASVPLQEGVGLHSFSFKVTMAKHLLCWSWPEALQVPSVDRRPREASAQVEVTH